MSDKERRENDALKNLIQAAYDFSDEQILAELEETEAALSDSDFPGIEDRMYQKLKARMAEKEEKSEEIESPENADEESAVSAPMVEEKKVVRFGKKKAVVVGLLAAAFVGMLGVTAIGGKNYFFRDREKEQGIVFNNDNNLKTIGTLEEAYEEIEETLGIDVLKLEYIPEGLSFQQLNIMDNKAMLIFNYNGNPVYFIQEQLSKEASISINSDRKESSEEIYNSWISKTVILEKEKLEGEMEGYAAVINIENARYRIVGQILKDEIINIIKYLNF